MKTDLNELIDDLTELRRDARCYREFKPAIDRIVGAVQRNQEFFDARCGQDCLEVAAGWLEGAVMNRRRR